MGVGGKGGSTLSLRRKISEMLLSRMQGCNSHVHVSVPCLRSTLSIEYTHLIHGVCDVTYISKALVSR